MTDKAKDIARRGVDLLARKDILAIIDAQIIEHLAQHETQTDIHPTALAKAAALSKLRKKFE